MLKRLELAGFKSFAKKTELHFKTQVTGIVGPNGSGKSNVAEAFRFALGEQSIKSMRGKRGEDLIWNGSTEISRSNRATVKLVFDNSSGDETGSKKLFNIDFDEVIIERVVNRDGSNEYFLNGSLVRLKDIVELLSQAHIGASGHHIISQGEADRILSSSIKERKEMIEDALGLKIYQYKREESERKLIKTEENIKQVESLRREVAPHLKFLKKQVEKVEKAEELRSKLIGFYKEYLKREKVYLEEARENLNKEKEPLKRELGDLEKKMDEAKEVLLNSTNKDAKSQKLIEIETEIERVRKEKDGLERDLGKIEGERSSNEKTIERTLEIAKSEEGKTIKIKEVENLAEEIFQLSNIEAIFSKIKEFISKFKDRIDTGLVEEMHKRNADLGKEKERIERSLLENKQKLEQTSDIYKKIQTSIEKEKESGREAEKMIFQISAKQSEIRSRLQILLEHEHGIKLEEEEFLNQVKEGGVLLGTEVLKFQSESHSAFPDGQASRDLQLKRRRELEKMKIRLEELGGGGGAEVMKEYKETVERDEFLAKELEDLKKSAESLEVLIKELLEKLDVEFRQGIEKINKSFQDFFSLMFGGGEAELKIVKKINLKSQNLEDEVFEEKSEDGIEIGVSLPRKRVKSLEMLSGGERALTSIALLFAISQVNPPPFIILDETDAALDEANSKKYGDMIEALAKYSQLILITHNRETMSRAGVIYGVTMGKDSTSRLLSIAFDEAVAVAK